MTLHVTVVFKACFFVAVSLLLINPIRFFKVKLATFLLFLKC